MVRRTRRDLSDKKVRKIIRKKQKESPQHRGPARVSGSKTSLFKPLILIFLSVAVVFVLYRMIQVVDLKTLLPAGLKSDQTEQTEGNESSSGNKNPQNTGDAKVTEQKVIEPVPQLLQVEVLNGCGVTGLAYTTTNFLRDSKIDVVYKGNYKNFNVEKSQIIDRTGKINQAMQIAKILGIEKSLVSSEVDLNKQLAATIILGKDYKKLSPFVKD